MSTQISLKHGTANSISPIENTVVQLITINNNNDNNNNNLLFVLEVCELHCSKLLSERTETPILFSARQLRSTIRSVPLMYSTVVRSFLRDSITVIKGTVQRIITGVNTMLK
jgi:hypothetical protein